MTTKYIANGGPMTDEFTGFLSSLRFRPRPASSGKLEANMRALEQKLTATINAAKAMIKDPIGKRSEMEQAAFSEDGSGGYYVELKHGKRTIIIDEFMRPVDKVIDAKTLDDVVEIAQHLLVAAQQRHPIMVQAMKNAMTNKPAGGPKASPKQASREAT